MTTERQIPSLNKYPVATVKIHLWPSPSYPHVPGLQCLPRVMERVALDSHKLLVSRHYHLSNAAPGDT